jgi:hypothetical protein
MSDAPITRPEIPGFTPAHGPPIAILKGVVSRLRADGFEVRRENGSATLVTTMTDGRRLALKVGDQVSVMGGPDGQGRFASGSILAGEGDDQREVRDTPVRATPGFGLWLGLAMLFTVILVAAGLAVRFLAG